MQKDAGFVRLAQSTGGLIKALHAWTALSEQNYLGIGSQTALELYTGSPTLTEITPATWPATATIVSLDNWGEFLMACAKGGPIYVWQPQVGGVAAPIPGGQAPAVTSSYPASSTAPNP